MKRDYTKKGRAIARTLSASRLRDEVRLLAGTHGHITITTGSGGTVTHTQPLRVCRWVQQLLTPLEAAPDTALLLGDNKTIFVEVRTNEGVTSTGCYWQLHAWPLFRACAHLMVKERKEAKRAAARAKRQARIRERERWLEGHNHCCDSAEARVLVRHAQHILAESEGLASGALVWIGNGEPMRGTYYPARVAAYVLRVLGQPAVVGGEIPFTVRTAGGEESGLFEADRAADALQAMIAWNMADRRRVLRQIARNDRKIAAYEAAQAAAAANPSPNDGEGSAQ